VAAPGGRWTFQCPFAGPVRQTERSRVGLGSALEAAPAVVEPCWALGHTQGVVCCKHRNSHHKFLQLQIAEYFTMQQLLPKSYIFYLFLCIHFLPFYYLEVFE
jgi:hypothetical protein